MPSKEFIQTIDIWINTLNQYSFKQLCAQPSFNSWSLGQVCLHILNEANYHIEQVRICLSTNSNQYEVASSSAKLMFQNNSFPNELIVGPPENDLVSNPDSKEQLLGRLEDLKSEIELIEKLFATSPFQGKTKHPGLNYFNAKEWFQFAEMHFRHHVRQKARIEEFLQSSVL